MQNAKDSFYIALRNRLAALNPERVVTVRAVQRPGILVEEAEAPAPEILSDVFLLRWTGEAIVEDLPCLLTGLQCEVHYATAGSQTGSGLDRGRALAAMDKELLSILQPLCTPKLQFTVTPAAAMQTNVFWTAPVAGALETLRDRLTRVMKVTVFAFEEAGEA